MEVTVAGLAAGSGARLSGNPNLEGVGMASTATVEEQARSGDGDGGARLSAATLDPPAWRGRLAGPFAFVGLATIGLRRTWALLAVLSLGMVIAVTLICTVPLYSNLVSDVQVQNTLTTQYPPKVNIEVRTQASAISVGTSGFIDQQMANISHDHLGGFLAGSMTYDEAGDFMAIPLVNGANPFLPSTNSPNAVSLLPPGSRAEALGLDLTRTASHMRIFAGRLPQATPAGQMPEVAIVSKMDTVKVSDSITLQAPDYTDQTVTARVVGVWYPTDESDPFWNGKTFDPGRLGGDGPPIYPVVFARATFLTALSFASRPADEHPLPLLAHSLYYIQPENVTAGRLDDTRGDVKAFKAAVNGNLLQTSDVYGVSVITGLDDLLAQLQQQLAVLALPLYIVVAQVVSLALLFIAAIAGLLVERQATMIATLKSRGVSGAQVLLGYTLQGALLAALAALLGPRLAGMLSLALVRSFIPSAARIAASALGQRSLAEAAAPDMVVGPAVAGAALGAAAVVVAALGAARRDVLALRREQGRSSGVPFWRRYYLDLGLVVLCAVAYFELGQFGGVTVRAQLGASDTSGGAPDPLLLAAPALLLLAGALVALRLFPVFARLGAWLAARGRGATSLLAFAQVGRAASSLGRLTLLLTLAVALGLFALDFQATLARNTGDQAAYLAGGDEQVRLQPAPIDRSTLRDHYTHLPGVLAMTPVLRSTASTTDASAAAVDLLAVEPSTFASVAYWRDDYANQPLADLMRNMSTHAQGPSAGEADHPMWALLSPVLAGLLHVRPGDRFSLVPAGVADPVYYVVGAVVDEFPTMFNSDVGGYLVTDLGDHMSMLARVKQSPGPSEYWLRTSPDAKTTAERTDVLHNDFSLLVLVVTSRRDLLAQLQSDPLTAGMTGLLLVGALTAAALAVVGSLVQSALAARQRLRQFAILRTLGMDRRQVTRMLLGEQAIVYLFGLVGGTALGAILTTATLPFLQFSTALDSPERVGVPPYVLVFNGAGAVAFYAVLAGAFFVALVLAAAMASRIGLGRTLRLGED
jgi:putative ABC transport system permease protein